MRWHSPIYIFMIDDEDEEENVAAVPMDVDQESPDEDLPDIPVSLYEFEMKQ